MNIVLIGMRGSGKTTVAKLLSKRLGKAMIEMDEMIVEKMGLTIPEVVEKYGWNYFRDKETEIVEEVIKKDNIIVSTGGGVITRVRNVELLKKNGIVFFLKVNIDTLLKRIGDDPNRPSLTGKKSRRKDMEEVLKQRETQYYSAADCIIDTEKNNAVGVTDIILSKL